MNPSYQLSLGLLVTGVTMVLLGSLHQESRFHRWDTSTFAWLHQRLESHARFFAYVWPLGTTPVALALIAILSIPNKTIGLVAALVYFGIAILENRIKKKANRLRPFMVLPDIPMNQPKKPSDSSFPSGDAMRTWFIALLLPVIFKLSWLIWAITGAVALILSLGRIALGVHYPLDVITGTGLGLAGAGITLLLTGFLI